MGWGSRAWWLRSLLATRIAVQNTDMMRDFFGGRLLRGRARFVPRGVDTARFRTSGANGGGLRTRLGIPADATVAGCVAHLVPVKGHPTLLDAAVRVPDLQVAGAGRPLDDEYAASLVHRAAELGISDRVHFLGGVDDVAGLLADLDIAVLPTWGRWRMEGCPVALIEALAAGRACVATDIPGSRDLVTDGHDGLLVPPEDPAALADALERLAADPALRNRLGAAARRTVLERYTIEREVDEHVRLYSELLPVA
jgi:glycosyltransferase involved in cell wall biosynthesis